MNCEPSKKIGNAGEDKACSFLEDNGYKILERNFRTRTGEVDIVALKGFTVVFVEVKTLPHGCIEQIAFLIDKKSKKEL